MNNDELKVIEQADKETLINAITKASEQHFGIDSEAKTPLQMFNRSSHDMVNQKNLDNSVKLSEEVLQDLKDNPELAEKLRPLAVDHADNVSLEHANTATIKAINDHKNSSSDQGNSNILEKIESAIQDLQVQFAPHHEQALEIINRLDEIIKGLGA